MDMTNLMGFSFVLLLVGLGATTAYVKRQSVRAFHERRRRWHRWP